VILQPNIPWQRWDGNVVQLVQGAVTSGAAVIMHASYQLLMNLLYVSL
jgi:hypothetical protein